MIDTIYIRQIGYNSTEYEEMVQLRYSVLRAPLGLAFTGNDLQKDENDYLIGVYLSENDTIVGCCILTSLTSDTVQLRQMAISENYQRVGIGSKLIKHAEEMAKNKGYIYIYLHARRVAVDFYIRYGYKIEGDEFSEVGISHFEMTKKIGLKLL